MSVAIGGESRFGGTREIMMLEVIKVRSKAPRPMNFEPKFRRSARARYHGPSQTHVQAISLRRTLELCGRSALDERQFDLLRGEDAGRDVKIYAAGDVDLLARPCVSIVGTREVSDDGRARAARLAKELTNSKVVIVSGLARGVDTAALTAAIEAKGAVVAVIGTPLDKAYPAENANLQELICREHLLISPFRIGERTFKANFPKRNRVMAALSDATVIVEASDTSGTLHQAAECQRLGRWLFIIRSVAENSD